MFAPAAGLSAFVAAAFLVAGPLQDSPENSPRTSAALEAAPDTIHLEVGSREVDGRVFPPHRARNRVYIGDSPTPVSTWVNVLVLGDSAGIPVMRWSSKSDALGPDADTWELLQTYHARTLEPLGYWLTTTGGVETKLTLEGNRIRGTRRQAGGAAPQDVDLTVDRRGFFAGASDLVPVAVGLREGAVMSAPFWHPSMQAPEVRVFSVLGEETVEVEGEAVTAWKVEEHRMATGELIATWWMTENSPFMVLAEIELPDGRLQRITGVDLGEAE
jgi:hypothetical protein